MECATTAHAPHTENLELLPFAIQLRDGFVPVDLCFLTPGVALRHERLLSDETHLRFRLPTYRRTVDSPIGCFENSIRIRS